MPPGDQAESAGFQRFEQTVSVEIESRARLDISLPVGSIGETVTVTGVTPLLSTESAVLGTVVNNDEMQKLPLAIRNWDDLMAMVPGVQSDRYTEQAAAPRRAALAASASTAIAACRSTSCSTASPTTASRPTCRN